MRIIDDPFDFIDDYLGFGWIDLRLAAPFAILYENIDQGWIEAFNSLGYAKGNQRLIVKRHRETDDWLNAAEVFLQHHKPIGEHNPREIVERRARLDLIAKRKVAQEIFAQALNVGDRQEGRAWADLTVVANHQYLLPPK